MAAQNNNMIPRDMLLRASQEFVPLTSKLNFEQRILKPNNYPKISNRDGSESTHRMGYSEVGGKFVAYPSIVQSKNGELQELDDDSAFYHAMKSGEFREFGSEREASDYSRGGYKNQWGAGQKETMSQILDRISRDSIKGVR